MLLDRRGGAYYVLNETGGTVWALVRRESGATVAELVDALMREYELPADVLRADVAALLARLEADRLVRQASS